MADETTDTQGTSESIDSQVPEASTPATEEVAN